MRYGVIEYTLNDDNTLSIIDIRDYVSQSHRAANINEMRRQGGRFFSTTKLSAKGKVKESPVRAYPIKETAQ